MGGEGEVRDGALIVGERGGVEGNQLTWRGNFKILVWVVRITGLLAKCNSPKPCHNFQRLKPDDSSNLMLIPVLSGPN